MRVCQKLKTKFEKHFQVERAFILVKCKWNSINPIQDGLFWGCSRMEEPKRPIPTLKFVTHILQWWNLAQLYLTQRRSKNYMNHVTHSLISADIGIFSSKISNFAISRNTDIDCVLIHNFYLFSLFLSLYRFL